MPVSNAAQETKLKKLVIIAVLFVIPFSFELCFHFLENINSPTLKYSFKSKVKGRKLNVPPPPLVVFSSKLEVRQCNSNEGSYNKEDDEDYKEDAVDGVNPMAPNTGKDVVELNVYGTERQKPCHSHLWNCCPVPGKWRNLPGVFGGAARSLEFGFAVFTSNTSQNKQRECD
jgi:hypothetical protein